MHYLKLIVLCLLLITFHIDVNCQFFGKLDLEMGVNRAKVFNTKAINSFVANYSFSTTTVTIIQETATLTTNYNMSIGIPLSQKQRIRIRYAHNLWGSRLTGSIQSISDNLTTSTTELRNTHNSIIGTNIGILYEHLFPLSTGQFSLASGIDLHKSSFSETLLFVPGILDTNIALHSYFGYLSPINNYTSFHAKLFTTYVFPADNSSVTNITNSEYLPFQIGIELGIRLKFNEP
ncbi:MAG: hypothetical protein P1U56_09775 [Saprospiraceae bacterium]|nr:hypothetical protein [Saprospiraceae bacterium]